MSALTDTLTTKELTTTMWTEPFPCVNLARNKLAASADAFTHLGEKWEATETFMDGACAHDKDPQLASAAWGVTDGVRETSGLVLALQTPMRGEVHGIIAAAWHTKEGGLIWTDNKTVEQTVARGWGTQGWNISPHAVLWHILWGIIKPGVIVRWTRGHATERQAVASGLTRTQWRHFQRADALAKATSKRQGPNEIDLEYRRTRIEAVQLACRLASEIWAQ